jgi:nitrate/TMAO reductase-like tetraheme cytochrome c subunit
MRKIILIILVMFIIGAVAGIFTAEYYTSQSSFCGSCHIMKNYYESWKKDKHGKKNVGRARHY